MPAFAPIAIYQELEYHYLYGMVSHEIWLLCILIAIGGALIASRFTRGTPAIIARISSILAAASATIIADTYSSVPNGWPEIGTATWEAPVLAMQIYSVALLLCLLTWTIYRTTTRTKEECHNAV